MPHKEQSPGNSAATDSAADQLLELARRRVPGDRVAFTIGDIVDNEWSWNDPDPQNRYFIWQGLDALEPERMAEVLRALLPRSIRDNFSTFHMLDQVKEVAFELGQQLLNHRDMIQAKNDALRELQNLIDRLSSSNDQWDVVLPIVNLWLDIRGEAIQIGPVLIVREGLGRFVAYDDNSASLGEFGSWAVEHLGLTESDKRQQWSGRLGYVGTYGKVTGLRGDRQFAIEQAQRDIETALSILRLSYHGYGSWSQSGRFGTHGSFHDPAQHFGIMGNINEGFQMSLVARSLSPKPESVDQKQIVPIVPQVPRRESKEFLDSIGWSDILYPVQIHETEINKRWPVIEQLVDILWSKYGKWSELAVASRSFAEGIEASTPEDAFLKFITALDVLLGRDEQGYPESQTTRIAERLAFLLGENDPNLRWRLFRAFKPLYGKRSGIVHGGANTTEIELGKLEFLVRLAILRMAWEIRHRKHRNLNDFHDWVRRLKFGEPFVSVEPPLFLQISDRWFADSG